VADCVPVLDKTQAGLLFFNRGMVGQAAERPTGVIRPAMSTFQGAEILPGMVADLFICERFHDESQKGWPSQAQWRK